MRQKASGSREGRDHTIPERTPISDQGRINSCVANSWCDALEILDGLEGRDKIEQLSRLFLYWIARYYTGDTDRDEGCYLWAAAHQLRKIGGVEEKYLPYKDTPAPSSSPRRWTSTRWPATTGSKGSTASPLPIRPRRPAVVAA